MDGIGRYRVVRPLGHGGMGQVFLAEDPTLERRVALKLLHRDPTHSGLREEAKALAALSHPGIVTIFEIGEHEGREFIAMEYVPGRTLRQLLDGSHAGKRRELLAICVQVIAAVGAAHQSGILHRDLKPENIIISDVGAVKVVDFGIARRLASQQLPPRAITATAQELVNTFWPEDRGTETDTIVSAGTQTVFGTPAYMAPEMLHGEPSSASSDVYSLGVVLHECVAGRRPYVAANLIETIALVIEGPPPKLDDPLGELIARMLARDPAMRPSLDGVARALEEPAAPSTPVRRSRMPFALLGAFVVVAVFAVAGWKLTHRAPAGIAAPIKEPVIASIAIAPVAVSMETYGTESPDPGAVADVLAHVLGEVQGARLTGIALQDGSDPRTAAKALGAKYVLTGTVTESSNQLRAALELADVDTGAHIATLKLDRPSPKLAQLIRGISVETARAIAPDATLSSAANPILAKMLYQQGKPLLDNGGFRPARPYFEQAIDADPTFADGWYGLALILGWQDAPDELVVEATRNAQRLTPPGPKRELMHGMALFFESKFGEARKVLEPLEQVTGPTAPDRRELLYYLGETNWHDGRHATGFAYFKRTLDTYKQFRIATIHPTQYTLARRDLAMARYMIGLSGENPDGIELAAGHYKQLAETGTLPYNAFAQLVLDLPITPELVDKVWFSDVDRAAYRIARAAEVGDVARARSEFAELWRTVIAPHPPSPGMFYALESLGEILIAAEMKDETRELVELVAMHSTHQPKRGYHRFGALAAGLLGDASLIVKTGASERNVRLATAMEAELAGDHERAAAILTELVGDPISFWDYPERAALIRNLRALGKHKAVAALCADTLQPAVFRLAFLVVRHDCRQPRR